MYTSPFTTFIPPYTPPSGPSNETPILRPIPVRPISFVLGFALPPPLIEETPRPPTPAPMLTSLYSINITPWKPRELTREKELAKMIKNTQKACEEHFTKQDSLARAQEATGAFVVVNPVNPYIDPALIRSTLDYLYYLPIDKNFSFSHGTFRNIASRTKMEDADFYIDHPLFILTGVLDGHKGDGVSKYVKNEFERRFKKPDSIDPQKDSIFSIFENTIHRINAKIFAKKRLDKQGSTAVICCIDKKTGRIYTATLGDSEANIYRRIDGILESIPLSCIRDWESLKDEQRAFQYYPGKALEFCYCPSAKHRRIAGLNVARAFGDKHIAAISAKPKITIYQLHFGDVVVLCSDGLKNYVPEEKIVETIDKQLKTTETANPGTISLNLRAAGMNAMPLKEGHGDNITVTVIQVSEKLSFETPDEKKESPPKPLI